MVDVHIYIVPPELWRSHQQSAVNQIINETVSAGFIRSVSYTCLQSNKSVHLSHLSRNFQEQ